MSGPGDGTGNAPAGGGDSGPVVHVVAGQPTIEELAALMTVLAVSAPADAAPAAPAPDAAAPDDPAAGWSGRWWGLRRPLPVGPGAWQRSGREPGLRTRADW